MGAREPAAFRFPETFVLLSDDDARAHPLEVTESFWPDLVAGRFDHLGPGRLVSCMEFTKDWDAWEAHPRGEELVCLLAGAMDFILDRDGEYETLELRKPGTFVIVPRDTFHTANVISTSTALFVTPGEGTKHRER